MLTPLTLASTDELFSEIRRRHSGAVLIVLTRRKAVMTEIGHEVRYDGCPYALAKVCEIAARDANLRLFSMPELPRDPRA